MTMIFYFAGQHVEGKLALNLFAAGGKYITNNDLVESETKYASKRISVLTFT